jgi:hypothetical protein
VVRCSSDEQIHFGSKYHHLFWKSASLNKIAQRESEGGEVLREKRPIFQKLGLYLWPRRGGLASAVVERLKSAAPPQSPPPARRTPPPPRAPPAAYNSPFGKRGAGGDPWGGPCRVGRPGSSYCSRGGAGGAALFSGGSSPRGDPKFPFSASDALQNTGREDEL